MAIPKTSETFCMAFRLAARKFRGLDPWTRRNNPEAHAREARKVWTFNDADDAACERAHDLALRLRTPERPCAISFLPDGIDHAAECLGMTTEEFCESI